ncbi:GNAT family N-acetyltransferase [Streptomyces sp. NPDC058045]|uniref:GNAT family N-acetyltransferase n=1 Tax=Streptomyces sp. NPDC058045 TaxID=3346311 RepID=UPI0036E93183
MCAMGGDQVEEAMAGAVSALRPAVGRDWRVRASGLEWDCLHTAAHLAGGLARYAGQLAARRTDRYVPFEVSFREDSGPADVLDVLDTMGRLFALTLRATPRGTRAAHPYPAGGSDPAGFAAMGVTEIVLHTHDLATGLGVPYEPPAALCEAALTHLFPEARPGHPPWPTLLWATGRGELPDRPRTGHWRWRNPLVIPGERIELRELTVAAATDLHLGGDGGFDWVADGPFEGTRGASGMLRRKYEDGTLRPGWEVYAIVRREDGRALGGIGFHGAPDEQGRAEVGYDLAPSARNQGYATEALSTLGAWAFTQPGLRILHAVIDPANTASQQVVTRAGFLPLTDGPHPTPTEDGTPMLVYGFMG